MAKFNIVNVVATASINQTIDFEILREDKNIFHDSDVYGGRVAYFKDSQMQGKVSIFISGKMISIGTKSEKKAIEELMYTKSYLLEKGLIKDINIEPKIQNIVVLIDLEKSVCLEEFSNLNNAIYEPEQFAGAILRITCPTKASVLVFSSGKVMVLGLKNENQIEPVITAIFELILSNE